MTSSPTIYATKSFPKGAGNDGVPHDAFSLHRSLLEQEDLLGVAIMVAQNFLKEPHGAADTKKVQTALREDEGEVLKIASFINTIPDPEAREALTARYDRLQKQITAMDLRLGQNCLALPQGEPKNSLPKLLFTVGFPAGFATTLKAMSFRDWVVGCLTGVMWAAAVCVAYKKEIDQKWGAVSNTLCSTCDKTSCIAKQKPESKNVKCAVTMAKCYVRARRNGHTL